jgi:hypothetical protein
LWKYINFIGNFDTIASDAKRLLERVGAWDKYGADGWWDQPRQQQPNQNQEKTEEEGSDGGGPIFGSNTKATHATHAKSHVSSIFGNARPEVQKVVMDLYSDDYNHPLLGLQFPKFL